MTEGRERIPPILGALHVSGNASLAGNLHITPESGASYGRFTILTHDGIRSGTLNLTGLPPGTNAHLAVRAGNRFHGPAQHHP